MSTKAMFIIELDEQHPKGAPSFEEHPYSSPVWVTFRIHPEDRHRVDEAIAAIVVSTGCTNPTIQVLPHGGAKA